jgi:class 3 adenylate cyclase
MDIFIYPSEKMQKQYLTTTPMLAAITTVLIFMFTSLLFILYDRKVERRQQIVMTSAERSNFVLSALFPTSVREKVLEAGAQLHEDSERRVSAIRCQPSSEIVVNISKPIADLYTDTTVLFCDIAGFTKWSSACEPCEVFTFLETLYGEFDKIAKDRGVFKVETIGDSYMAVTGIPHPMKNHATTMVRFARDILLRMKLVTEKLSTLVKADINVLQLRVGLHSGPCTAGVLRGDKSRFQLFGDTVNTASRMESTGIPGQIQCSQSTADLLLDQGKEKWLRKRENIIEAKGKGLMQSYWLVIVPGSDVINLESLDMSLIAQEPTKGNK